MAISDRVEAGLAHFRAKNWESALLELSAAIDQSAKHRYPGENKVGVRFRSFITHYREFIMFGAMGFGVRIFGEIELDKVDNTIAKLLYKRVRNPVVHDAGLNEDFVVMNEPGMTLGGPSVGLGNFFILAAFLAVIGEPANHRERLKVDQRLAFGGVDISVNNSWGQFDSIEKMIVDDHLARMARVQAQTNT